MNNDNVFFDQYLQFYIEYKKKQAETPVSELTEEALLAKAKAEYDRLKKELNAAADDDGGYSCPMAENASVYFSLPKDERIGSVFDALCQYAGGKSREWSATQLSEFLKKDVCNGTLPYTFGSFEPACVALAIAAAFGELQRADIVFLHSKWEAEGDYQYDSHVAIRCIYHTAQVFTEPGDYDENEATNATPVNVIRQIAKKATVAMDYAFACRNVDQWMDRYGDSLTIRPQILITGKTFAFDGFGHNNEEHCVVRAVVERGGLYHADVTATTDYLVVNPRYADDEKIQKAIAEKSTGIQIVLIDDLMDCLVDASYIKKDAYNGREDLTEFTIPGGVMHIEDLAFANCKNLTSITIPSSVITIGYGAFMDCKNLASVTIPDGVTAIGESVFSGCEKLTAITIPNGVTVINGALFAGCHSLKTIVLPDSVERIWEDAFQDCTALESLILPASVNNLCLDIPSQVNITVDQNNTTFQSINNCLILTGPVSSLILGFKNSVIPTDKNVQIIGGWSFRRRTGPETLTIPKNITKIESWAFEQCEGLKTVIMESGVKEIGEYAFCMCASLTSVTLSDKLKKIEKNTFDDCTSLETVDIRGKVTSIEEHAFNGCSNLKHVTLPNGLKRIGPYAFMNCTSLESIHIPASVTHISKDAFKNCKNLKEIINDSAVPVVISGKK